METTVKGAGERVAGETTTTAVTDEEVEEFYAIIRRIHEVRRPKWQPVFRLEDFRGKFPATEEERRTGEEGRERRGQKRRFLDLNADPEPEGGSGDPTSSKLESLK